MVGAIRRNFGLKVLSVFLAIVGWAYFRFANNPLIAAHFDQQISVPVTAVNMPPGYIAVFPDKTILVTVTPKRGEAPVKPEEIHAVLDLSNRTAGVYNIPVQLVAPNITVQARSPASESITVERVDAKPFPVAVHYSTPGENVVSRVAMTPSTVEVHGPSEALAEIAAIRVEVPLNGSSASLDEMIRPAAVDSSGQEIADVQIVPNLVRVQAQFLSPGTRK